MFQSFHHDDTGRPALDLRAAAARTRPDLTALPALNEEERQIAIRTWRGRMVNEHCSAQVWASLLPQLMRAAVPAELLAAIPEAAADELRHAEACAGVVAALGGDPHAPLPELPPLPDHADVGALEAALRNVVSVGCMSETIAVSVIRAEHAELEGGPLADVLEGILADEIRHARFGWTVLGALAPRLDAAAKSRLNDYLVDAFRHQIEWEIPKLPVVPGRRAELAEAGVCDGGFARELFFETIESVIVPGLTSAGLDALPAWQQARREAFTHGVPHES